MDQTTTPMMVQWHACKEKGKDALLLFRLGDFYEAFYDDAKRISKELGLTLTQRQGIPMCGVPFHTADQTIDKLVARGHKVAIAEQTEDPKEAKGLVKREISRVISPGTLIHSQLLSEKKNNYILSLYRLGHLFGLAVLDLTTGEFRTLELEEIQDLADELYRLRPSEFLLPRSFQLAHAALFTELSHSFPFLLNEREEATFDREAAAKALFAHIKGFSLEGQTAAITAAGTLLSYLKEERSLCLDHVTSIQNASLSSVMSLDRSTVRNLELTESLYDGSTKHTLLELLDQTATAMGGRLLAQWLKYPLRSIREIEERQEAVAAFLTKFERAKRLHQLFESVRDLERLIAKITARYATPRDLWSLGISLTHLSAIREELSDLPSSLLEQDTALLNEPLVADLAKRISSSLQEHPPLRISEGELFRDGVHPELDRLRSLTKDSITWMANYQNQLREETGIKTLKVGYTRAFGYYIEVSRSKGEQVPPQFQRRQTLVNAERFITDELKRFEHQILTAQERAKALEIDLFEELRSASAALSAPILAIAKATARIDALLSLAITAKNQCFARPLLDESDALVIEQGRHPVIERAIGSAHFIPNDTHLDPSRQLLLLTGPNMAGKSTYIRQVALIVILAQMGSYVPAASARIGLVDRVFSRIGASDDLARGQSTFMVEMTETAHILHHATSRSLVILDEIGRGTSTYDGISIAWAVAEYLLATPHKRAKTLFATHYWELTRLEKEYPAALNMHAAVQEIADGIVFLRKIVPGGTDRSYGIHVAKLAGLPFAVIKRAQELLHTLEAPRQKKQPPPVEQLSLFSK